MKSCLFEAQVSHTRSRPFIHSFTYPLLLGWFDLDEIANGFPDLVWLSANSRNLFSVDQRKSFFPGAGTLLERVREFLQAQGEDSSEIEKIFLLTTPNLLGFGFNPVSFYYCFDPQGAVRHVIAEVNNTFGQRHFYFLSESRQVKGVSLLSFQSKKAFHVSPFLSLEGHYDFRLGVPGKNLDLAVDLIQNEVPVLRTRLVGESVPLSNRNLVREFIRFPLTRVLTIPRILKEAAVLYYQKKATFFTKPQPSTAVTITTSRLRLREAIALRFLRKYTQNIRKGRLHIRYHDGTQETVGGEIEGKEATLCVRDPRFYSWTVFGGDIGFGESYTEGHWDTPNLSDLLVLLIENRDFMGDYRIPLAKLLAQANRWFHLRRKNRLGKSKKNIGDHYDLGNGLFERFLDPSMTYSCAYYADETTSLEEAQEFKIDRLLDKAQVESGDHVLEIGSGWGSLALRAAKGRGCRLTTTTLSENQFVTVQQRLQQACLQDQVSVLLSDYRLLEGEGTYDKIVSVEMFEAVGYEYWPRFFEVCDRLLKKDGKMVLQVITIPDRYFEAYRKGCDWIQKHIFPGGFLPSVEALKETLARSTPFAMTEVENIGPHYARTLRDWRDRFLTHQSDLRRLGYSESFCRKWLYYFAYCEAAFATETLGVHQIVVEKRP